MRLLAGLACVVMLVSSLALQGGTKLSKATFDDNLQEVRAQLHAGEKINDLDKWGWTPLMWAVYYRYEAMTKWLLNHGADPNIKSVKAYRSYPPGTTALGLAAYYGLDNLISPLMAAKADPNAADANGTTPIAYAKAFEFDACLALMQDLPKAATKTQSKPRPTIEGKLDSVFILIQSNIKDSQDYLYALKIELEMQLQQRSIRHVICVVDPMSLDEKEYEAKMAAFKPKYILVWAETGAMAWHSGRRRSDFFATLSIKGESSPRWEKDTSTWIGISSPGSVGESAVGALLDELESDQLL